MSGEIESRKRDSVFLLARIAGADGKSQGYRVRNLSSEGVCIVKPAGIAPEDRLIVSIGMVENIAADVMWVREDQAGLRFVVPINPALARKRAPRSLGPCEGWRRTNRV